MGRPVYFATRAQLHASFLYLLRVSAVAFTAAAAALSVFAQSVRRAVTVDDLMTLRAIVDARISPDGQRVAYVVSTPSLPKNEHEAALFLVPASGGSPVRVGESVQIFNVPVPSPRLRWSPDGTAVSVMAIAAGRPQVVAIPIDGGTPRPLTSASIAPEGVFGYEWSPDGSRLAFLTRDPMDDAEARARADRSFVQRVDAPDRAARLGVVELATASTRILTPSTRYVDAFSWAPDS